MIGRAVSSNTASCLQSGPNVESKVKSLLAPAWFFSGVGFSTLIVLEC